MRSGSFLAVFTAVVCLAAGAPVRAVTPIFLVDTETGSPSQIYRVNRVTGELTLIGTLPPDYSDAAGLAAADQNTLYVATLASPIANRILRVTVNPFSFEELGAINGSFAGLAYANGQLFGIDEFSEQLYRIGLTPPISLTLVGAVRVGSQSGPILDLDGGDIAPDGAGNLYLWTNSTGDLYRLNVTTAVATQLDPSTTGSPKTGLAIDYQGGGTLFASARLTDSLDTLNPATGATMASIGLCFNCPTPLDLRFGDLASPLCTDEDGDGFSPEGASCGPTDCNDANNAVSPAFGERCNGIDDDCDGAIDEEPAASGSCASSCTATAECRSGACVTTPIVCNDGNPCTSDACNPASGCTFTNQPNGFSCSDGNVCSGEEICSNGTCTNPADLDCGDGNGCTVDTCSPPNGCRNLPVAACCTSDADCADASRCTENERCVAGQCLSDPVNCSDGNPCTNDSCSPSGGCANIPVVNGISCGDGNVCNGQETCQGGSCTPGTQLNCNDGNVCTIDGCNPQTGCTQQATPACCTSDADCGDASACTVNERCLNNACSSDPLPCNDGNVCTTDSCNPASGCVFTAVPNGQSCSDLDFCDGLETCQAGACATSAAPNCNDGNPCTTDGCNSSTGCTHTGVPSCCFTDGDCVDADACTVNERCVDGTCRSDPRNCMDGNRCTADACDPAIGCTNPSVIDGSSCDDASVCDGSEACAGGTCRLGTPPNCDDRNFCTQDGCDNVTGCRHDPVASCCNTDAECADTDQCTTAERCTAAHTCLSTPRVCVDDDVCTLDGCTPAVGCTFTPLTGTPCDDGDACTTSDQCSAGTCAGSRRDCSDGDACNGAEPCIPATGACASASGPLVCTPGSRKAERTCAAEWLVTNPNNLRGVLSTHHTCVEGDTACDHDADSATCTFEVGICLRVPDPRLVPACRLDAVVGYSIRRPRARTDPALLAAMLSAVGSLPGAAIVDPEGHDIEFSPSLGSVACTAPVRVVVPLAGRTVLRTKTTYASGLTDRDTLLLDCLF